MRLLQAYYDNILFFREVKKGDEQMSKKHDQTRFTSITICLSGSDHNFLEGQILISS